MIYGRALVALSMLTGARLVIDVAEQVLHFQSWMVSKSTTSATL